MTDAAIERVDETLLPEQREEAVITALLSGRTVRSVRKEFGLSIDEIDAIIARTWPVDSRARVRMIMTDLGKLDRMITEFYRRSLIASDALSAAFATVAIKAMERKHELTGMSAATRIDLQIISEPKPAPKSFERIKEAIFAVARDQQPNGDGSAPALEEPGGPGDANGEVR